MNRLISIVLFCALTLIVGFLSSFVTVENIPNWYSNLVKPSFNIPVSWFSPIWTIIYVMIGIAAGLVASKMKADEIRVKKAILYFFIQLTLNALWSYLFFGMHNLVLSSIEICLLALLIYETYVQFKKIDKIAGFLMLPYFLWVIYASVINIAIWYLN
jgi:benzodiazapine receptor